MSGSGRVWHVSDSTGKKDQSPDSFNINQGFPGNQIDAGAKGAVVSGGDTHLASVDLDGVALSAIQGLYQTLQEKETLIITQQEKLRLRNRVCIRLYLTVRWMVWSKIISSGDGPTPVSGST